MPPLLKWLSEVRRFVSQPAEPPMLRRPLLNSAGTMEGQPPLTLFNHACTNFFSDKTAAGFSNSNSNSNTLLFISFCFERGAYSADSARLWTRHISALHSR